MKIILTAIFILASGFLFAQSFEGTLTYVSDFEPGENMKKVGMTKEKLIEKMKHEGKFSDTLKISYKQGDYYSWLNDKRKSWTLYNDSTNKIYSILEDDICSVTDASMDLESMMLGKPPVIEKMNTTAVVNGDTCNIVKVEWQSGTYYYYYAPGKLTVDPALFAKHINDGWAAFLNISKALPVKIVKETKGMITTTMTLAYFKSETVNEKRFAIPHLVPDKNLNISQVANRELMRIKK